jgi:hypothetical protein
VHSACDYQATFLIANRVLTLSGQGGRKEPGEFEGNEHGITKTGIQEADSVGLLVLFLICANIFAAASRGGVFVESSVNP